MAMSAGQGLQRILGRPASPQIVQAPLHLEHEFVEVDAPMRHARQGLGEQVHQHGLAAADAAMEVDAARRLRRLGLAPEAEAGEEAAAVGGRRRCRLQLAGEPVEACGRRLLQRVVADLACADQGAVALEQHDGPGRYGRPRGVADRPAAGLPALRPQAASARRAGPAGAGGDQDGADDLPARDRAAEGQRDQHDVERGEVGVDRGDGDAEESRALVNHKGTDSPIATMLIHRSAARWGGSSASRGADQAERGEGNATARQAATRHRRRR